MVGRTRRLFLLCLFGAFLVAGASGVRASAAPVDGGLIGGDGDDRAANTLTTATAVDQGYADGPNGTVFTMTTFETADGEQLTVKTHGGIRSDGVGQHTSHEARFTVGKTYRMPLSPSVDAEDQAGADGASGPIYRVVGGDRMVAELTASGEVVRDATPDNFVLLPFSWAWTLPDNPPVYLVNPNAPGVSNELSLVQQGFAKWEDDPGSSMDWTYGGTTGLTTVANDGNNTVFWANTPDPADDFLARATTFFNPNTGQAFDTDILFNNDFTWVDGAVAGAFDVMSVAIHESGHSLGLDHAPNNAAIMFFSISSGTVKRNLSLGDRGGVAAIYPPIVTGDATVSGSVSFDGGGAGVSGVGIDLFTENRAAYLASTTTNSNGDYTLTLPGAGCYVITFIAPQGQTFTNASQYLNAPFCATAGQAVTGINAEVIAPGSETSAAGRVADGGGAGVSGVGIDLFTENRAAYLASTTTNSNGDYTLTLPGAGCYVITFIAPQGQTFTNASQYLNAPFCATAGQAVTGINAQTTGGGGAATLGDSVTNQDGSGEPNVEVVLYQATGDGSRGEYLRSAFTDGSGAYSLSVAAGCYVIDFVAPSGRTWVSTGTPWQQLVACVAAGESNLDLDGVLN